MLAAKRLKPPPGHHRFLRKGKPFIANAKAAEAVLQCLESRGALNRVIVEANSGPGVLTKALLKAGALDVRVLEYRSEWKQKMLELRSLYPMSLQVFNCNLMRLDGLTVTSQQSTSSDIILKDVPKKQWSDKDAPGSLICTFNAKEDYKTIFHLLYNCQDQHGIFSWGRFNMIMIVEKHMAEKLTAPTGSKFYGRMAVTTQLNCHIEPLIKLSSSDVSLTENQQREEDSLYEVMLLIPKTEQPFLGHQIFSRELLQNVMVSKNKKLLESLRNYHHNPKELLLKLSIGVNKQVRNTSPNEFLSIITECYKTRDLPNEQES